MEATKTPGFTAARIVALALIGLVTLGLVYLHLTRGDHRVSVPSGAHANQLTLHSCHYGTALADCGTLVVRENRHDPESRLIALPVTRIHATSAHPGNPIFRLQGGPGISNMSFPDATRFTARHDVVLVGYRGIDGSSRLDCPEVVSAREHSRDLLTAQSYTAVAAAYRTCAVRLQAAGVDLAGYSLPERVDDLDAVRRDLGYRQVDLLSESAGTRTAMIYTWRYPGRVQRSVMIGVNPPGHFLWDARTTGEQIRRYAALCRTNPTCRNRTPDLTASIHSAFRQLPGHFLFLPIRKGNVEAAAFFGFNNATSGGGGPIAAPRTIDALLSAGQGDGAGAWFLSLMAQLAFPRAQVWGEVAATGRSDSAYARRYFARHADRGSTIGSPGTDLVWAGGSLLDAWPSGPDDNLYTRVRDSDVETLLVGGRFDFATPPQNAARELLPHLPNGHQVVLPDIGHSDDFWGYQPAAGDRLVNTFFDTGRIDSSLYKRTTLDFTPAVSDGTIAEIVLGVLLSLAGLTVLSLLWLALRAYRRGGFGPKASTGVRALYVVVLGLGGWCAGALIVLVAFPTVPLDDELLTAFSVGIPVGLATYLAWARRGWSARTRAIGFVAAAGGALVGAWLGFQALEGLLAVVTTIAGAVVGSNVLLLGLDIAWDRQAHERADPGRPPTEVGGRIVARSEHGSHLVPTPREPLVLTVGADNEGEGGGRMSRTQHHSNLAARMGRWSAAHWKKATFGWLAFVVVAFGLGGLAGTTYVDPNASGPGQSGRMDRILDAGFKQPARESVLIESRTTRAGEPAFDATVGDVIARISKLAAVRGAHRGAIAKDARSELVDFTIRGDKTKAADRIQPVLAAVAAAQTAHPGFTIGEFGDASAQKQVETAYNHDLGRAGMLSLPVTLLILVIAFGALVAAGLPLLLALTAVFATFGLIALSSRFLPVAFEAPAMVLLIGLAVGVDYSMFYLKRERQERAAGRSPEAALEAAAATSGRSVLISGLTVMAAMAGMFLTGNTTFASLAIATILVVAVAVLGSLTVLPALLSRLGDRVDRLRLPLIGARGDGDGRIWGAIVDRVLARPGLSAALSAGLLLALAMPALQLRLAPQGVESFPGSLEVIKVYERMQQAFPGTALPANVVVQSPDVQSPAVQAAIAQLERRALASGSAFEPITVDVNRDRTVANITLPIAGNGTDAASNAAFHLLRDTIVPQTVGAVPGADAGVTGQTAQWKDTAAGLRSSLPPVVAFVLLLAFALMLIAFRSIVIALKAIVLNLLSVAAAYGVLVLVFQHGIGSSLLGVRAADGVEAVVPLLLFVILFGLSMDYHVFVVSRIREFYDRGEAMDDAVRDGIRSTAGVVTSAAVVMVFVFAVFATLSVPFFKQFGVGLAAAILIDATIVRAVLLPATMKLLGRWNWYLPRWLEWMPRLEAREPSLPATPAPAA